MAARIVGVWVGLIAGLSLLSAPTPMLSQGSEPRDGLETVIVRLGEVLPLASSSPASLAEQGYVRVAVPEGQDAAAFAASLLTAPGVLSAEADSRVYAAQTPNDPFYHSAQSAYLALLGVEEGWDLATGSTEIVVAVIDTGLDTTHEDLVGRLWQNPHDITLDGIDDDGNGCIDDRFGCRFISGASSISQCGYGSATATGDITDDHGSLGATEHSHGTLVSGIIGATGNNGVGVTGVAWNIKIMTVKVLDCGPSGRPGGSMSDVALAIDYARRMGADIINLSLSSLPGDTEADKEILRSAIEAALAQDVILVAAAGNGSEGGVGFPAAYTQYTNVVGVGSSDNGNGNVWATFSGVGAGVDFAAPGKLIAGTTRPELGDSYGSATGTSFSTPLVTGMFALMKSRNSALSHENLIQVARDAATPASAEGQPGNWAGSGIINIGKAVARVPMIVNGDALEDWRYMESGIRMRAFVGSTECGTTTTEDAGGGLVTRFLIRVATEAEKPGCGAPGREVRFLVGGDQAQTELVWGSQNEDLALQNRDVVVVSPPPGSTVVQRGTSGWSLVAHLPASGPLPAATSYLPGAWTELHMWVGGSNGHQFRSYIDGLPEYANGLNTLEQFAVYWVNGNQSLIQAPKPAYPSGPLLFLKPGWNAFLYTGASREVSEALAAITGDYAQVLQYDNRSDLWLSHIPGLPRFSQDFGGLMELQIYWVFYTSETDGFFTIE